MNHLLSDSVFLSLDDLLSPLRLYLCLLLYLFFLCFGLCLAPRMAVDDERCMIMEDNFEDLGDLLLPNSSDSISWNELELDSDGEIRLVGDLERSPFCPTLILNNNGALDSDGEIRLASDFDRNAVSPTLILYDYGGDGTAEENAREEVKGGKFPLELSKKVRESNHQSLDVQRQQWQNFPRVIPKFPDSPSSGSKLALDSDGEIWSVDAFEGNLVSPTLILNNNGGNGTVEEKSREEKVSPTFILNNNGGDGTVQEKTREKVKGRKFLLGVSKKVCKSSHPNFGCRRQKWGNSRRVSPNSPVSPLSWSESMSDLGGEIRLSDDFDRNPVSTTFFLNDNGGNGTVEENTREDEAKGKNHPPDFSEKAHKSNHWSLACRRQQLYPAGRCMHCQTAKTSERRCVHCQTEKTPQWRAGPMGRKTLCNACGVRYKSGRLSPEYRPAASPTFDSLKHSNFHRKIARNLTRNQLRWLSS